ncbi:hypothetical protein HZC32_03760 [Candidatus Woesearchaeota archaeon]|nr:hypothetical protein [Candidatus Woesearchaeota archaeon]
MRRQEEKKEEGVLDIISKKGLNPWFEAVVAREKELPDYKSRPACQLVTRLYEAAEKNIRLSSPRRRIKHFGFDPLFIPLERLGIIKSISEDHKRWQNLLLRFVIEEIKKLAES